MGGAVVLGAGTAAYDVLQLITIDQGAQAGQAGGQTLTSTDPETARFNLAMGYCNLALSAIRGETGQDPQDIQKVQSRIPGEFDGIRSNLNQLSDQLTQDPSSVVLFDSLVAQQLQDRSMSPQERKEVTG